MADISKLLATVRRVCKSGTWSTGVSLSQANAVALESQSTHELVLRVKSPGRAVPVTVVLYPGDVEWDCDCPTKLRPCEHIAAAVIAVNRSQTETSAPDPAAVDNNFAAPPESGAAFATSLLATSQSWARVVYRFQKGEGGLLLRRFIVDADGTEKPIERTLSSLLTNSEEARRLQVENGDLLADRLLESGARGLLPATKTAALLQVLVDCRQLFLNGRPVAVSDEELLPRAVLEDKDAELILTIQRDPRITDILSAGVVLCGDTLHRHAELELAGAWLQNLPQTRTFTAQQLGELTTRTLPELSRRMPIEVRSKRIPKIVRGLLPRLLLELAQNGPSLSVLPKLVYGTPPCVRIDDGRMVHLGGPVPVRDEPMERRLGEKLRTDLNLLVGRRATFSGPDMAPFVSKLKQWRGDLVGEAAGMLCANLKLVPRLQVQALPPSANSIPQVKFELNFVLESAGLGPAGTETAHEVSAAQVVQAWRDGLGLLPLQDGGWAALPQAWLDKHGGRLAELLAARQADGRIATHALPNLRSFCAELNQPLPANLDRLAPLFQEFTSLPASPLPKDLMAQLRDYQRHGTNWLAFLRDAELGGILADDMGLGKTLQALTVFTGKTLVIAPASVLPNWKSELARFRPALRVSVYHGPARKLDSNADVTLTTYTILRLDSAELGAASWNSVVLDEAQNIKNPDSKVARAAFALRANFRLALSGTPIENRLDELWSLMNFANPGLLGGRRDFEANYSRPIADGDKSAAEALRQRIFPFILRRLKREVAPELPPRTDSILHVTLDERERAVYDAVRAATRAELVALFDRAQADFAKGSSVLKALEALLRLRQAACHSALVPGQSAATSSKVATLVEALQIAAVEDHKALVFSQWTSMLDLIEPALKEAEIPFLRLDGSTRDRGEVVTQFQSESGPPVLLISLKAGGTGLNLTAADSVFLCDPWWNPAVEDQAADRAHRIGQDKPVSVYRLVSVETVEERILLLQEKKRALVDAALAGAQGAAALTREDLLALLE